MALYDSFGNVKKVNFFCIVGTALALAGVLTVTSGAVGILFQMVWSQTNSKKELFRVLQATAVFFAPAFTAGVVCYLVVSQLVR